jgi:hypothetical protein
VGEQSFTRSCFPVVYFLFFSYTLRYPTLAGGYGYLGKLVFESFESNLSAVSNVLPLIALPLFIWLIFCVKTLADFSN